MYALYAVIRARWSHPTNARFAVPNQQHFLRLINIFFKEVKHDY